MLLLNTLLNSGMNILNNFQQYYWWGTKGSRIYGERSQSKSSTQFCSGSQLSVLLRSFSSGFLASKQRAKYITLNNDRFMTDLLFDSFLRSE